jgi:hypothetical protein
MTKNTEELEALVERLENIDFRTLSAEDRNKLREELLQLAASGTYLFPLIFFSPEIVTDFYL